MCKHYHPLSTNDTQLPDTAFTRRNLLHAGLTLLSTAATVPMFLGRAGNALADTSMRLTSKPGTPQHRVLVVVQLSGGNDGLNTVVPFGEPAYYRARPDIAVSDKEALPLPGLDGVGLHPNLRPIHELIQRGRASVLQGVGYPNPNRSHFVSMDIWHTASPQTLGNTGRGWIGRAIDTLPEHSGLDIISIGAEMPLATMGETVKAVAFERPDLFRWAGRDLHASISDAYDQILTNHPQEALAMQADAADPLAFVQRTAMDAQVASDRVRKAVAKKSTTQFPGGNLSKQLESVAKMIAAELPTRVYYVTMGGFDTHANQASSHANLMRQFADAMSAFDQELQATGQADRVVTMAFSEFGRRVQQNASGGTDHGCAGPMFIMGPAVKSPTIGQHPSLQRLDDGDLVHQLDFRHVYSDILQNWMKIDTKNVLSKSYPALNLVNA